MSLPSLTVNRLADLQPADFEQLANRILRAHPPYESLIPTGLNERGRPVPAPVDAVCWIPGTCPPKGVLCAYTATTLKSLREKWLLELARVPKRKANREGDVIKALRRADEIRCEIPQADMTLVLACTVDPAEALVTEVKARCTNAGVEVDFWTVSRLSHFLDYDPHGQFLRQEFLEIPALSVSSELLRKLSAKSCSSYAAFTFEDTTIPRTERGLDRVLREEIRRTRPGMRFLVAESGLGKSSAALALLREYLASGGSGLWLTPEDVASGGSIEGAVETALRRLQPELLPGCGAEALEAASGRRGLLLVVDDLSRSAESASLLHRISSWATVRQDAAAEHSRGSIRPWFVLCPIWPRFLSQLTETARDHVQSLCIHMGTYTAEEGAYVLQARARFEDETLTAIEARRLSDALGHDPLLLNLADLRRREPWEEGGSRPISLEVLDRFLENHYIRLAQQEDARFAASDYKDALFELADWMLKEREMVPTWRRIRSFSSGEWRALQHIVADRQIAHLSTEGGEEVLHFRHDRVRDAILAAALASQMKMGTLADVLLDEPFYAELFGQALLASGVDPAWVDRLCERTPLALFRALQLFETPRSSLQEAVITGLKAWLAKEVVTGRALDALQWEAVRFLAETDSPFVLELSRSFPETWHGVSESQFRNGEVAAAVAYCTGMELGVPYVGFVALVEHVQIKFGAPFSRGLAAMLTQGSLSQRQLGGALFLAGHLGEPDLAAAVRSSWERATGLRIPVLAEFLWAALRCLPESDEEADRLLDPFCEAWRTLPGESPDPSRAPENVELIRPLQDAFFWRGLDGRAVSALIRRASGSLHWPITVLLRYVDAPDAVDFTVRQAAARDYWGYTSAWEHWDFHGRRLGTSSTERLKALWRSPSEEAAVRKKAFHFWDIATQGLDFDLRDVQCVGPSEPFYREALKCRIEIGDQTAVAELIHMTETAEHPHSWWQHAHRIWNETLRNALDSFLGRLPDDGLAGSWEWEGYHFCAAGVLIEIPTDDAEGLLVRHWEHLRYRRLFVQTALAIATPRCRELVAAVVSDCPEPRRLFEHFDYHCGLRTRGKGQRFGNRQLQAILPYLDLFSANTIESFWQNCNEQGWLAYRRRYLDPRLTLEQRRRCRLEQAGLSEALDRFLMERLSPWSVDLEIEHSQRGGESWPNILAGLLAWLQERRTLRALDVVAHALVWAGRRIDLPRLGEVGIAAEPNEIQQIIDRTTFQVSRRRLR